MPLKIYTMQLAEIKALIGYFDLDPNRVFSLIINAFAAQPDNGTFLQLVPIFERTSVAQLLGFQFSVNNTSNMPQGLFAIAAKMVKAGFVKLEEVISHLHPSDASTAETMKGAEERLQQAVARIGIISLTATDDNKDDQGQQGGRRTGQTAASLELDSVPFANHLAVVDPANGAPNQKLQLLAALLNIGDWDHAQKLMHWLAALGVKDFAVFPEVGVALCALIQEEVQQQYARLHPDGLRATLLQGQKQHKELPQLSDHLLDLLHIIGHHLYHNVGVLTKLVRVLGAITSEHAADSSRVSSQQLSAAHSVLGSNILPAMALLPSNVALIQEIWAVLSPMPYTKRFCFYAELKEDAKNSALLTASAKLAETEVRRILRRVTAPATKKEAKMTMKPLGRMLAKIMHANPLAVAEQLLRQVMGMPGMVASIVESLKYLTPMAFDVLTFAILKQFASPRKKLKDDGVNLEEWFQWLAAFTGVVCKKYG